MKQMGSMLMDKGPFSEIVMGNAALVRAMVEAGTEVVSSYPGSPTPEIGEAIVSIPEEKRPFYFEFSVNEKVATEVAFGASVNGRLSTVFFKSVGLNVAADSFVQLPLMELIGGMVVVLGDDPGANSSQNEQDNRHYSRMAYAPVFEPGDPQEVYEMYLEAVRLSRERHMPIVLRLSTHICHAKSRVSFGEFRGGEETGGNGKGGTETGAAGKTGNRTPLFDPANGPYIPLTSQAIEMKHRTLEKIEKMQDYVEESSFNRLIDNGNGEFGIITSGLPFYSLLDVLASAHANEDRGEHTAARPDIFKIALSYPIPKRRIVEFCRNHREVLILEELDPILEQEIKTLAFDEEIRVKIHGKQGRDDLVGEYTPAKVRRILSRHFPGLAEPAPDREHSSSRGPRPGRKTAAARETHPAQAHVDEELSVPERPAQMCPGCGHRSAFHAIKKVIAEDSITVADIGCHTLGSMPPYRMGQVLTSMGHSNGTGAGLSLFNSERKVITFLGDSTFFHAGMPGVVNAVYNNHDITLVVMLNDTTAMTGHQDHPGTGKTTHGPGGRVTVRSALEGLGVQHITETDTYNQKRLGELIKEAVEIEGFSVVIARHPCMLKFTRERRRAGGTIDTQARIDQETCRQIHHCVSLFGCPSFVLQPEGQVTVNPDLCIGDGSCLQTCPVQAIELEKEGDDE